jgi:hypothetical protein
MKGISRLSGLNGIRSRIRILVSVLSMRRCFVGIASDPNRAIMIADLIASRYTDII